ncbi:hypothetical protein [Phytohabitans rumicis]|nr:hypothetical protein [Phytohabitans rumicis]
MQLGVGPVGRGVLVFERWTAGGFCALGGALAGGVDSTADGEAVWLGVAVPGWIGSGDTGSDPQAAAGAIAISASAPTAAR